ncbi:hypothetical protein Tco_0929634 [Tanacetum coccineum]
MSKPTSVILKKIKDRKNIRVIQILNHQTAIRRFEMMKYSFNDDEEYITIKESEYLNHSKDSLDAYQELLRLIDDRNLAETLMMVYSGEIMNVLTYPGI